MNKKYLVFMLILLLGIIVGYAIGTIQSARTNSLLKIQNTESAIGKNGSESYVYEKTIEDTDSILVDLNNDGSKEVIKLISTGCYKSDNSGKTNPIGCAGRICLKPDKYCEGPYKEISFYDPVLGGVNSEKIYTEDFSGGGIKVVKFNNENFIELSGLNMGAHSSETRIFRIVKKNIEPVCRKIPNFRDERIDNCVFYSDAGGAALEIHDNSLVVLESFKTDSVMNTVDGVMSSRGITSIFKNGEFVTQR